MIAITADLVPIVAAIFFVLEEDAFVQLGKRIAEARVAILGQMDRIAEDAEMRVKAAACVPLVFAQFRARPG